MRLLDYVHDTRLLCVRQAGRQSIMRAGRQPGRQAGSIYVNHACRQARAPTCKREVGVPGRPPGAAGGNALTDQHHAGLPRGAEVPHAAAAFGGQAVVLRRAIRSLLRGHDCMITALPALERGMRSLCTWAWDDSAVRAQGALMGRRR